LIGWETFLFLGIFCLAAADFSFLFVPETSRKSLEQIAPTFGDNVQDDEEEIRRRGTTSLE
jgi:hypothetical protein